MTADLAGKLLALLAAFCWGFAVLYFKRAGSVLPPMALNLYKTAVAIVLLLPVFFFGGFSLLPGQATAGDWLQVVLSGSVGITAADSLFFVCLNLSGAGLAAIAECLYSPFVMLLSWLVMRNGMKPRAVIGAALVIAGVLVVTVSRNRDQKARRRLALGMLAGAAAMLLMAVSIVLMKPVLQKSDSFSWIFWVTELRLVGAFCTLLPVMLVVPALRRSLPALGRRENWRHAFPGSILGNVLSMVAWVAGFKLTDMISASILNQTNTIVVVLLASFWLKEPFTRRRLLATLLAVAGSALVLLP